MKKRNAACGLFHLALLAFGCAKVSGIGTPIDASSTTDADTVMDAAPSQDAGPSAPDVRPDTTADATPRPCQGLECQQVKCPAGSPTSISGTAFAPNGKLPLYNVMAYVPNAPLEPFKAGVTCDRCGVVVSGRPVASAISNHEGKFKIDNAPAGKDIPLILQVGKWRRRVTVAEVTACRDNPVTDANLTRLPRNRQEGDMPNILAMSGECDSLSCVLPKVGIDPGEFGFAGQNKAVTFFKGFSFGPASAPYGAGLTSVNSVWRDETELQKYDLLLLGCECFPELGNKGPAAWRAMTSYLGKGGRIFSSHFMYVWYQNTPDPGLASALTIDPLLSAGQATNPIRINTSFPKGKALADWITFIHPARPYGEIVADELFGNTTKAMPPSAQSWATSAPDTGPRIASVNTPAGVPNDQQCGRAVQLDAHIFATKRLPVGPISSPQFSYPNICGTDLKADEEVLAFLFFDLAACLQDDSKPVEPPPVVIP